MKNFFVAMSALLLVWGCAQEPAELPAPKQEQKQEQTKEVSPKTRGWYGTIDSTPEADGNYHTNKKYSFLFIPDDFFIKIPDGATNLTITSSSLTILTEFTIGTTSWFVFGSPTYASGGMGTIRYEWYSSRNNSDWTLIPGVTSSTPTMYPPIDPGVWHYRRKAIDGSSPRQEAYSNTVTINFKSSATAPKPAAPILTQNKQDVYKSNGDYAIFTVSNYANDQPNTTFEWRSNGDISLISPSWNYVYAYPGDAVSYLEVECRVAVNGALSDWSTKYYVKVWP